MRSELISELKYRRLHEDVYSKSFTLVPEYHPDLDEKLKNAMLTHDTIYRLVFVNLFDHISLPGIHNKLLNMDTMVWLNKIACEALVLHSDGIPEGDLLEAIIYAAELFGFNPQDIHLYLTMLDLEQFINSHASMLKWLTDNHSLTAVYAGVMSDDQYMITLTKEFKSMQKLSMDVRYVLYRS